MLAAASSAKAGVLALLLFYTVANSSPARTGVYTRPGDNFGQAHYHVIQENESLLEIARNYDLGYNEIVAANPQHDPFIPAPDTTVIIPSTRILPDLQNRTGLILNRPEMRIYYFPHKAGRVQSFPVGIGEADRETPLGTFTIIDKISHPSWYVPQSIRQSKPELPKIVPPGPDNPMGSHALRLSRRSILIHGTNRPFSIGRRASHGCIRMYPEDIIRLFNQVSPGTRVTIIDQPIKITEWGDRVFLEAHGKNKGTRLEQARKILRQRHVYQKVDEAQLKKALREARGIPVDISRRTDGREEDQSKGANQLW